MRSAQALLGKLVISGTGEPIGRVVGMEVDETDRPFAVRVREHGPGDARFRVVELEHVHAVDGDRIRCKGPRQGYHITRLGPPSVTAPPSFPHASRASHGVPAP